MTTGHKLYIVAKLPSEYRELEIIKTQNRPYSYMVDEFIAQMKKISDTKGLSFLGTLGYIEESLSSYLDDELAEKDDSGTVEIQYRTESSEVIDYYNSERLINTQMTALIVKLIMRLRHATNYSIPKMIYLLEQLEVGDVPNNSNDKQKTKEAKPTVKIVKRKTDTTDTKPKVTKTIMTKKKSKPKIDQEPQKDKTIDKIAKRVQNLEKEFTGEEVPTNPLLGEFYDF